MSGQNGPEEEHEGKNSGRESWTEKVTLADAGRAVGDAVKTVDKVIWVFERFYRGSPHGKFWLVRSFFAWLGIVLPWLGYLLFLEFAFLTRGETIWPPDGYPILTTVIIGFVCGLVPPAVAVAITHRGNVSYAECFFGLGLRIGGYFLVAWVVLGQLFGA